jgi:hypothetical protein
MNTKGLKYIFLGQPRDVKRVRFHNASHYLVWLKDESLNPSQPFIGLFRKSQEDGTLYYEEGSEEKKLPVYQFTIKK